MYVLRDVVPYATHIVASSSMCVNRDLCRQLSKIVAGITINTNPRSEYGGMCVEKSFRDKYITKFITLAK